MVETTNKGTFMAVGVGIVIGVGLLVGISAVVTNALDPVSQKLDFGSNEQSRLERTLVSKLDKLEGRLNSLEAKIQMAAAQPQAQRPQQPQQPEIDLTTVHEIPVADSYVLGKADAPITIVEFTDLQCPFCSRFHGPISETLKAYPDKVKVILKNFPLPFHPQACPAAKAALAAGLQGKYFEMVDLILQNQQVLSDEKYKEFAGQLGLKVDKFLKDIQDNGAAWDKRFDAETELGNKVGVRGTPTYFLNGKQSMARTAEQWKAEVEALLKK